MTKIEPIELPDEDKSGDDENLPTDPAAEPLSFIVPAESAETRLDSFLASMITGTSRSQIRKAIELCMVAVNNKPALKPAYAISEGDQITLTLPDRTPLEAKPEPIPLNIVYEDDELIVVNKPAGMVTHPGAGAGSGTLANGLVYHLNQISVALPRRGGTSRPGIVHRLDVGTSGLIVAAKTDQAHLSLANQFQARTVYKNYLALVYGTVNDDSGVINASVGRDSKNRVKMAVVGEDHGRSALTHYRVVERFDEFTLLEVEIKTGRTHQIRVHLTFIKHPIVGDSTYDTGRINNIKSARLRAGIQKLKRPFLHAARLSFDHPATGERINFSAPLPDDLEQFLRLIRN
jgi:23S rRNA pseudouridine1911/1915/1917 synthase